MSLAWLNMVIFVLLEYKINRDKYSIQFQGLEPDIQLQNQPINISKTFFLMYSNHK